MPSRRYNMPFIWLICLIAAMGGLLFGYDWVVVGGAKPFYEPFFGISDDTPFWRGWAQSSALVGCLIGAVVSGVTADRLGRRRLLILAGALFTVSAVGTGLAWDFVAFNGFRILGGLGIGLASNLSPMYIAEVSPAEMRGRFVSINQLTIVLGILSAQIVNWLIADPVPTVEQLRLLAGADDAVRQASAVTVDVRRQQAGTRGVADPVGVQQVRRRFGDRLRARQPVRDAEAEEARKAEDAAISATYLMATWNGQRGWRWMFAAETVPALLFFMLMFLVPESPRWLIKYGRRAPAEGILRRVGGDAYARSAIQDIQDTLSREEIGRVRLADLLEPRLAKVVGFGAFLAVFQQWCGINVIFNYAQEVFAAAGFGVSDIMFGIVITGLVNLAFTFVAIYTVDRLGRRPLMLLGAGGLAGIYAVLGAGYYFEARGLYMLILVVAAIGCYAMSLAPIVWVVISEIFPNRIRGAAMSIAVFALWVACTALTLTFPFLNRALGAHGAFWTYGAICVVGFLVVYARLPETKGKSLEDIERQLVD